MELTLEHVDKSFKQIHAVRDVTLQLGKGVHGLLGANGSGKTTLMRLICGLIPLDKGSLHFMDINALKQYDTYASYLGYLPQHFGYYPHYSVYDFLSYMSILKNMSKEYSEQRIETLLERLNLQSHKHKKLRQLSGGMLQRVGIAQSLLNHPKLLILDEPSSGLDPKERIALRQLLSRLAKDTIVILSTHIVSDIENIADDILLMKEGHILFQKTVTDTLQELKGHVYELLTAENEREIIEKNYTVVNCKRVSEGILFRLLSDDMKDKRSIVVEPTLDDVYLSYFHEEAEYVETNLL